VEEARWKRSIRLWRSYLLFRRDLGHLPYFVNPLPDVRERAGYEEITEIDVEEAKGFTTYDLKAVPKRRQPETA